MEVLLRVILKKRPRCLEFAPGMAAKKSGEGMTLACPAKQSTEPEFDLEHVQLAYLPYHNRFDTQRTHHKTLP